MGILVMRSRMLHLEEVRMPTGMAIGEMTPGGWYYIYREMLRVRGKTSIKQPGVIRPIQIMLVFLRRQPSKNPLLYNKNNNRIIIPNIMEHITLILVAAQGWHQSPHLWPWHQSITCGPDEKGVEKTMLVQCCTALTSTVPVFLDL